MTTDLKNIPYMLFADKEGRIYDHPYYRLAGNSGSATVRVERKDLIELPAFSKLFYIPDCPPLGLDPETGEFEIVPAAEIEGKVIECRAVAAFPEPGYVRSHLPAADYGRKSYTLPMWGYTAVGFGNEKYWMSGFQVEYNHRWDPRYYDDGDLVPAIKRYKKRSKTGPLVEHLENCATGNHCFAAKNLFLRRWEAPLPVSRTCNARCLGCLSLQPDQSCTASHDRIAFRPGQEEIIALAVEHLTRAEEAIVSFGQGCEGEPLTEYKLIAGSIKGIRAKTARGTINLNTNGSWPERVAEVARSGLDSIRISLNSARPELYQAYYRPRHYHFDDVVSSLSLSTSLGLYTMINYLVFPGVTDQEEEIEAMTALIRRTGVNFIHLKNLNIDPRLYLDKMPLSDSRPVGMKNLLQILGDKFPGVQFGYFNRARGQIGSEGF